MRATRSQFRSKVEVFPILFVAKAKCPQSRSEKSPLRSESMSIPVLQIRPDDPFSRGQRKRKEKTRAPLRRCSLAAGALLLPRSLPRRANAQKDPVRGVDPVKSRVTGPESARYGRVHVAVRTEALPRTYSLSFSLPPTKAARDKAARARFPFRGSRILPPPPSPPPLPPPEDRPST